MPGLLVMSHTGRDTRTENQWRFSVYSFTIHPAIAHSTSALGWVLVTLTKLDQAPIPAYVKVQLETHREKHKAAVALQNGSRVNTRCYGKALEGALDPKGVRKGLLKGMIPRESPQEWEAWRQEGKNPKRLPGQRRKWRSREWISVARMQTASKGLMRWGRTEAVATPRGPGQQAAGAVLHHRHAWEGRKAGSEADEWHNQYCGLQAMAWFKMQQDSSPHMQVP